MAQYYSGANGKKQIRSSFPHHMLMANLKVAHKYLHPIDDREYWESITEEQKKFYIGKAEEHQDFIWKSVPVMEIYMDYFTDENHSHLDDRFLIQKRDVLLWLTIGECIENKGRFLRQIINGVFSLCEQSTWAPASHFLQCGESKELLPDPDEPVLDLYATIQGRWISITYSLLKERFDAISPVICQRIEKEIDKRIITPYLTRDLWWMCENLDLTYWNINNWTTHCCLNILSTTLAMGLSKKITYQVVNKVIDQLDCFVDAYPDDGACDEGPSYWAGAVHDLMLALELLETVICGKTDIWNKTKIAKMTEYILHMRIHRDIYASVSDAHPIIHPGMFRLLAMFHEGKLFQNEAMMQEAATLYTQYQPGERTPSNFILEFEYWEELKKYKAQQKTKPHSGWMPGIQIMSSHEHADTGKGMYLCVKGGNNGESHNHNDVGSFIVYKNGKPVIIDAGIGLYTKNTFGENRYKNWWANGLHHSIPIIGGIAQKEGGEYEAENVSCVLSDDVDSISLELKSAYSNKEKITSLIRRASLNRKNGEIVVEDAYVFTESMTFESILLMHHKPEITENGICCGDAMVQITGAEYKVEITEVDLTYDHIFSEAWGDTLYRVIIRLDSREKGKLKFIIS